VKALLDRSAALALVMLLALVLVIVAIAIRLDSPGPVFFRQRRRGLGGRPFTVLKFRTMADGASPEVHRHYIEQLAAGEAGGPGLKKLTDDPRVTRVGRVLRKLSLDELPQLANVVAGQMSLVGPRPAIDYELEHYQPHHYERFEVKPGLTGLWRCRAAAGSASPTCSTSTWSTPALPGPSPTPASCCARRGP
jgi:lipopolysaccharide/colanic/teichoic acid biosynthesis glycosyltransferase